MARELASQGADVLGVDSSANLIEAAVGLSSADAALATVPRRDVTDLDVASDSYDLVALQPPDERPAVTPAAPSRSSPAS